MIYLFYGEDKEKAREEARVFADGFSEKNGNLPIERIYPEELSTDKINELVLNRGLFGKSRIIIMDGILGDEAASEAVLKEADSLAASADTFVFLEGGTYGTALATLKDKAEEVFYYGGGKTAATQKFNVFSITDAFGRRDRKSAWISYWKAILAGVGPEEIHAILVWQAKNILLAKKHGGEDPKKFGVKPFVWNKAKSFSKNFKNGEMEKLSSRLVDIYHGQRIGTVSFEEALEKFILSLQ